MKCDSADVVCLFFFNDTATTEIYTLSLHDALPISRTARRGRRRARPGSSRHPRPRGRPGRRSRARRRSEEHTSELQSRQYLVCRLLLEKKKKTQRYNYVHLIVTHEIYYELLYRSN